MPDLYKALLRPALFGFNPEQAHGLSIRGLKTGLVRWQPVIDPRLQTKLAGLTLPNPLGLAAGYDKNAAVPDALLGLGFGHVEIGTVTPKPQPGNPKPRMFRLPEREAVINRLGFNSGGHAMALANLDQRKSASGIVGINIGANKDSEDFAADYVSGIHAFAGCADYFTINISSPNTPGLRALQGANPLADLLHRVDAARQQEAERHDRQPCFLKIAPDLSETELDDLASAIAGTSLDGLIVSNTTLDRSVIAQHPLAGEAGGLSGKPLRRRATICLAKMRQRLGPDVPIIGVGGIGDAASAIERIEAGAHAVQLYSAMIYEGPRLPGHILRGMCDWLDDNGLDSFDAIRGRSTEEWAAKAL